MTTPPPNTYSSGWICCQLGAREHYAIPRALHSHGLLRHLLTDAWVHPGSLLGRFRRSWGERFHSGLTGAQVSSSNSALLRFELAARLCGLSGWNLTMARNRWFQSQSIRRLQSLTPSLRQSPSDITLFAYSYAALELFRFAKIQGWRTVMGQIDAGPAMERAYMGQEDRYPEAGGRRKPPPARYWQTWSEECRLADHIVVNSPWSRDALIAERVDQKKIGIIPLEYEAPDQASAFGRAYPSEFSTTRPLKVLFLGQINLLKGIMPLLEAARGLANEPVEFWLVGRQHLNVPEEFRRHTQIRWIGSVPRSLASRFYRDADVFLFPTLSDGFGLTQLEAQAWQLPVIASRFCGEVVQHGVNGLILNDVTGGSIEGAIRQCLRQPALLAQFCRAAVKPATSGLEALGLNLLQIKP
jgi:glycosyltransferase involved in cell wall biosynthesis